MVENVKEIGETHPLVDMIRVDTGDFMDYAQQFYLSCGFERAGHIPHYLSWNNHQVVFVYQLRKTWGENGAEGEINTLIDEIARVQKEIRAQTGHDD